MRYYFGTHMPLSLDQRENMKTKIGILGTGRILFMLATLSVLFAYASASALEPQILASLTLPNGVQPQGGLILGPDGNFYGTTRDGGSNNLGTVFRMTPNGVLTSLFAFNVSFDEVVVTLFISGVHSKTLPVKVWDAIIYEITPILPAISALIIAASVLMLTPLLLYRRRS